MKPISFVSRSVTRKKVLVELLYDYGLSVSYDKVLGIFAQSGDAAVSRYEEEELVCFPVIEKYFLQLRSCTT